MARTAGGTGTASGTGMAGTTPRRARRTRRPAATLAIAAVALLVGLTGCSTAPSGADATATPGQVDQQNAADSRAVPTGAGEAASPPSAGSDSAGGESASSGGRNGVAGVAAGGQHSGSSSDVPVRDDRQIIRTASVALQVTAQPGADDDATRTALADAAARAAARVRALAPGTGGYVSASDGGGATISITLRIPADSYDTVLNGLGDIGRVTSRTEKTDDVTDQLIDVASRIDSLKASIDRIRTLLSKADKIGDVITIESELAQREADLESLQGRQAALQGQVALSTIAVTVTAVTEGAAVRAQAVDRGGFLAGLDGGWQAMTAFGTWLASVVGALLPFLPLIAAAVLAAIWIRRRRRTPAA